MAVRKKTRVLRNYSSTRRARRRGNGIKVLVLLLATVASAYAAFKLDINGYFAIREVSVDRTIYIGKPYADSLCRSLFLGRNILSDLDRGKKALAAEPLVKSVRCLRNFPDRLRIQIEERQPVALVNTGELLPVDAEGFILPLEVDNQRLELPIITPKSAAAVSKDENLGRERLNKDGQRLLEAVLAFHRLAPEMLPRISEFTLDAQGKVTLVTMDGGLRVVMGKWIKAKNIEYLKWMLEQLAGTEDKPALIDLSFEGQIIVKNNHDS